jgi:hypothetical protein
MYRETFVPSEQQRCFTFPSEWYGKEVEVMARPVETHGSVSVPEAEYIPIWKRYPGLSGSELMRIDHEEFLSSKTPEELAAHRERCARRWAEIDRIDRELGITMDINWYREWRKEEYGYDPDYYKQLDGE